MPRHRPKASPPAPIDLNPRTDPPLDFPVRALGELTPRDYEILGFMCGLEVHQQLDTRGKLFCRCPAGVRTTRVDAEVLRHMRPTLSELGEYDGTALMEFRTRKEIVYRLDRRTVCTYEIDDTPPFPIDEEAIRAALEIATLYGLDRVSELQVMRKQYLDGSIPTGFQRTAMVALAGVLPFPDSELGPDRVLRIRQLTLEEDSCREVSDVGHRIVFRTDRLGMPLTETVTEPDLLTPRDVAAGGSLLAWVARASGRVRRGPGAARQDVNVSIAGSRRVEIKGVCQHKVLPRLVHIEAYRHLELLRIRAELLRRGVTAEQLVLPQLDPPWASPLAIDARTLVGDRDGPPIQGARERGDMIAAVRLPGFAGILAHRTQPSPHGDLRFDHELAERLRVIACLTARPFMAHTDEASSPVHESTWRELRRALRATADDAVVVVWGPWADVATAVEEIVGRGREALVGVPSETRQAHPDGTTGFERILPGPERMYPDTDTPPWPVPDAWLGEIDASQPERPWERERRYVEELGLGARAARVLVERGLYELFDALAPSTVVGRRRLASALECRLLAWWRESGTRTLPESERLRPLVLAIDEGKLRPEAYDEVFDALLRADDAQAGRVLVEQWCARSPEPSLAAALDRLVAAAAERRFSSPDARMRWALGQAMPTVLGHLAPAVVRERLLAVLA
ncbi:Glu-tRNA(Gln) amidotransferase subunit GatE [Paraliomyxa miuraensis]|uniref:Glu-tRNA(Gln) amidotransferase subunit GatE n=1 Tax=Paraliomyxa miuraensis TaxID=376150 RepID=UPI0022557A7D|nr:Glu-tRNA(Gln) amidotransferase subunit GatE [Paraliomyxa miuraensis]MCX4246083.1 Glu-tRNA(Gln) amidotransferase subunit GatE [Paraliomyxa miuraensis]